MKLYSYFNSSATYRVRIALNLKGIAYEIVPISTVDRQNRRSDFRAVNLQMRVPVLVTPTGAVLIQSLAVIEYLEEMFPEPALLPKHPIARARVRALAQLIACDIHPLNNISPLDYLKTAMRQEQDAINAWYHHWVNAGFEAIEGLIDPAPYACGSEVSLADLCLVPQVYNARRFKVPMEKFPKIVRVDQACLALACFDRARPENQPDAE